MSAAPVRVMCIDDNRLMAESMQRRLTFEKGFEWAGWVEDSADAPDAAIKARPDVVMLDIDMPGRDCFDLVRELCRIVPASRVLMFSGHVRPDYVDRAVEAGAWGYVSKNDSMDDVLAAIKRVAAGEFVLTPDVSTATRPSV